MMRGGKIFLIVGGRGTGKTTYLENLLPNDSTICELFVTERYKNFKKRVRFDDLKLSNCVNTKIIIEDATQIVMGGGTLRLRQIMVGCKQMGSDVFMVFHSVNFIPPFVYALFDYMVLFASDPVKLTNKTAPYYDAISAVQKKRGKQYAPIGFISQV